MMKIETIAITIKIIVETMLPPLLVVVSLGVTTVDRPKIIENIKPKIRPIRSANAPMSTTSFNSILNHFEF